MKYNKKQKFTLFGNRFVKFSAEAPKGVINLPEVEISPIEKPDLSIKENRDKLINHATNNLYLAKDYPELKTQIDELRNLINEVKKIENQNQEFIATTTALRLRGASDSLLTIMADKTFTQPETKATAQNETTDYNPLDEPILNDSDSAELIIEKHKVKDQLTRTINDVSNLINTNTLLKSLNLNDTSRLDNINSILNDLTFHYDLLQHIKSNEELNDLSTKLINNTLNERNINRAVVADFVNIKANELIANRDPNLTNEELSSLINSEIINKNPLLLDYFNKPDAMYIDVSIKQLGADYTLTLGPTKKPTNTTTPPRVAGTGSTPEASKT